MKRFILVLVWLFCCAVPALAQRTQPTNDPGCTYYSSFSPVLATNQNTRLRCDSSGNLLVSGTSAISGTVAVTQSTSPWVSVQSSQYPSGATPITASATGTTGATTATLAGTSGKTTYICGMSIRANATAAATGNATVTGTITGTLNFTQWTAPLASGLGVTEMVFMPCVPASATNTGIAIISAAPGSGGVVSSSGWGYQL